MRGTTTVQALSGTSVHRKASACAIVRDSNLHSLEVVPRHTPICGRGSGIARARSRVSLVRDDYALRNMGPTFSGKNLYARTKFSKKLVLGLNFSGDRNFRDRTILKGNYKINI